jgi:NADP-dependent 3-hydroxy acid dehydrogenase YdfG
VGRSESTLAETQKLIPSGTTMCSVFPCDVTDEAGMEKVATAVGTWDVMILNAGYISAPAPIAKAPLDNYWKNYEVHLMLHAMALTQQQLLIALLDQCQIDRNRCKCLLSYGQSHASSGVGCHRRCNLPSD